MSVLGGQHQAHVAALDNHVNNAIISNASADGPSAAMHAETKRNADQRMVTQTQKEENLEANVRSQILEAQRTGKTYCVFDEKSIQDDSSELHMFYPSKNTLATYLKRRTDFDKNSVKKV